MHRSLAALAAAAGAALTLAGPTAAIADDTPKGGTTGPGDVPAETMQRMKAQAPLTKAASAIMDAVDPELARQSDPGFTSISLGEKSVIVRYRGNVSPAVKAAIDKARADAAVELLPAKFSRRQLETAAALITKTLKPLGSPVTVVLPAEGDKLRVEVKGDLLKTKLALPRVGLPVDVVPGHELQLTGRMDDTAPYYGGARINRQGGGSCTAGFGVRGGSGDFILTAGHCGNNLDWFSNGNGTRWLGQNVLENTSEDLMLIRTPDGAGPRIFDSWIGSTATRTVVPDVVRTFHNEWLCAAGSVTGAICDIYADTTIYSYCDRDTRECYNGMMRGRQAQGKTVAQPGDSGGPLYNLWHPNATTAQAKGIISGVPLDSAGQPLRSYVYFQDFWAANQLWGVIPK